MFDLKPKWAQAVLDTVKWHLGGEKKETAEKFKQILDDVKANGDKEDVVLCRQIIRNAQREVSERIDREF